MSETPKTGFLATRPIDHICSLIIFSGPAGLRPPTIRVAGPTLMNVSWEPPLQPNGVIEFYTVRLPEPRIEIRNISILSVLFDDLVAYTEYSVTVTACTSKSVDFLLQKSLS